MMLRCFEPGWWKDQDNEKVSDNFLSSLIAHKLDVDEQDVQLVYQSFCGEVSVYCRGEWVNYLPLVLDPTRTRAKKRRVRCLLTTYCFSP